jgi:hypothetical protein
MQSFPRTATALCTVLLLAGLSACAGNSVPDPTGGPGTGGDQSGNAGAAGGATGGSSAAGAGGSGPAGAAGSAVAGAGGTVTGTAGGTAGAAGTTGVAGAAGAAGGGAGRGGTGGRGGAGGRGGQGGSAGVAGAAGTGAAGTGVAGVTGTGGGPTLIWPNDMSKANSDPWLSQNHNQIAQLRPRVLVIDLENTSNAQTLVDRHITALSLSTSFHRYKDPSAQPAVVYQLAKIVRATKGSSISYPSWNTQTFADSNIQMKDPADPSGPNQTLCQLFEKGIIHEVWCMASSDPKCGETQEKKQRYDANGNKMAGSFVSASNGTNITTGTNALPCTVTVRVTDFNSGRGVGCHQHAMAHAWERYMDAMAVPTLRKEAARFLNWDLMTRVGAPFNNFYNACNSNSTQLTDCIVWDSQIRARSGPTAATAFDIADMSGGCGNGHFYANTTGTYSYDARTPDPTVLSSCENYGMHNGTGGKDLTTPYNNAMTGTYASQQTGASDDDCGGHGTSYLYQNFPGPGTKSTNDDGTPMHNWWVYLFY